MVLMAAALMATHITTTGTLGLPSGAQLVAGVVAMLGGLLLGVIPDLVLIPVLALILLLSAIKLARHDTEPVGKERAPVPVMPPSPGAGPSSGMGP